MAGKSAGYKRSEAKRSDIAYLTILPGLKSKFFSTMFSSSFCVFVDVPYSNRVMDMGSATPIAYDT